MKAHEVSHTSTSLRRYPYGPSLYMYLFANAIEGGDGEKETSGEAGGSARAQEQHQAAVDVDIRVQMAP